MNSIITKIRAELTNTFNRVFDVFAIREDVLYYQPANNGWSIHQVVEHLVLANYFLLRIVNKQTDRAMQISDIVGAKHPENYQLDMARLKSMELSGSYIWVPQRFTEPSGDMPLLQLKMTLHDQLNESLMVLDDNSAIEAIINMYEHGRLDALHYLYFLVQHIQRHLGQIGRVKKEFYQLQKHATHTDRVPITDDSFCLN